MSTSMVSTVLEIEREAETIIGKSRQDAEALVVQAREQRDTASATSQDGVRSEIAQLESKAAAERDAKVKELTATGDAALAAVKNISDAAFDGGVQYILKALAEK